MEIGRIKMYLWSGRMAYTKNFREFRTHNKIERGIKRADMEERWREHQTHYQDITQFANPEWNHRHLPSHRRFFEWNNPKNYKSAQMLSHKRKSDSVQTYTLHTSTKWKSCLGKRERDKEWVRERERMRENVFTFCWCSAEIFIPNNFLYFRNCMAFCYRSVAFVQRDKPNIMK